jgi:hypothetical protein
MAFLTLAHHDPLLLTDAIMEYEANDGCFCHLSHRISSRWMHLRAGMSVVVDLVSRPLPCTKPISIVVMGEGLISRDKHGTIDSRKSLIITHDAFEAQQYSFMLASTKHCLIKSQRKLIPKMDVIIAPKSFATYLLTGTTFHRIIFPFNYNQRHLVFKTCKFSYSLSHFCIFYDWQVFQTFVWHKTFIKPTFNFIDCVHEAIDLQKFQNGRCIIFDDRSQGDFYREYPIYQQGLKKWIHVTPPLAIERCDTRAFETIVIVCSFETSAVSFVTSLRQVCHEQLLDIHVIYTHPRMKVPYTTHFNT